MRVWRLTRSAFQQLDGEGARLYGGRWNSPGTAAVYASATLSLAVLELLVHVEPLLAPDDQIATKLDVPDTAGLGAVVDPGQFPAGDWRSYPAPAWQAELGDLWIKDASFLWLAVPSAIVPEEHNILINPRHPRMRDVSVVDARPFRFDRRLL